MVLSLQPQTFDIHFEDHIHAIAIINNNIQGLTIMLHMSVENIGVQLLGIHLKLSLSSHENSLDHVDR